MPPLPVVLLDFELHKIAVLYAERVRVMEYARTASGGLRLPAHRAGRHGVDAEVSPYERQQIDEHFDDDF